MKITEIRGYHVGFSLAEPIGNAVTFIKQREFLMLEVVTDAGITGWGEVGAAPHPAAAFIRSRLARILLGQSPLETNRLWQEMTAALNYDRRGVGTMGISAVDLALHDISAKAQGISIAALLGGAVRDRVFAYASGPFMRPGNSPYARFRGGGGRLLPSRIPRGEATRRIQPARRRRHGNRAPQTTWICCGADDRLQSGLHRPRRN